MLLAFHYPFSLFPPLVSSGTYSSCLIQSTSAIPRRVLIFEGWLVSACLPSPSRVPELMLRARGSKAAGILINFFKINKYSEASVPFPSTPQATSAVQMRKTCFLRFINLIGQNSSFDDVSRSAKSNYEDHDVPTPIIKIWNIMDFFLKKKISKSFED